MLVGQLLLARRRIRDIQAQHELVLGSITDHVTYLDTDLRIVWSNARVAGSDQSDRPCYETECGVAKPCASCPLTRVLEDLEPAEGTVTCREGAVLRVSAAPVLDQHGRLSGVVRISRDITEKRRLAERLQQVEKMEAVGQLAAGVAHDFNNSLQAILGYSELLDGHCQGDEHAGRQLNALRRAADRARDVVSHLLAFGRKQEPQTQTMDLSGLLAQQAEAMNRLVGAHLEVRWRTPEAGVPQVAADPSQVEQVLVNLCVNARDAMPDGGVIEVGLESVVLDSEAACDMSAPGPGSYVVMSVSDQGHGISAAIRDRIFDPFFTTKSVDRGTGLGLSTVYGIVNSHDGFIEVDSAPGRGSSFRVGWPVAPDDTTELDGEIPRAGADGPARLLLVEDDADVRELAARTLGRDGHRVETAGDGREALQRLVEAGDRFDAVIMDVMLPGLNGWTVYRRARRLWPRLPVIFTSGHGKSQLESELRMSVPDVEFIQKPYLPIELSVGVRCLLDTRDEMDPQEG